MINLGIKKVNFNLKPIFIRSAGLDKMTKIGLLAYQPSFCRVVGIHQSNIYNRWLDRSQNHTYIRLELNWDTFCTESMADIYSPGHL